MDFLELCKKRFSTRKFSAQKIDEQTLEHIMECVRMAPIGSKSTALEVYCRRFRISKRETCAMLRQAMVSLGSTLCHLHEGYDKQLGSRV